DSVPGDPRDGARSLCAAGQGGLPAKQRLGRGAGGGLHVVARVLPAGLLCRRPREVPVPALQGRQSARQAESAVRLTWLRPPARFPSPGSPRLSITMSNFCGSQRSRVSAIKGGWCVLVDRRGNNQFCGNLGGKRIRARRGGLLDVGFGIAQLASFMDRREYPPSTQFSW